MPSRLIDPTGKLIQAAWRLTTTPEPPQLHSCDNCEGVDPASCLMNSGRSV